MSTEYRPQTTSFTGTGATTTLQTPLPNLSTLTGIEPDDSAPEAAPLCTKHISVAYAFVCLNLAGVTGFEPVISISKTDALGL